VTATLLTEPSPAPSRRRFRWSARRLLRALLAAAGEALLLGLLLTGYRFARHVADGRVSEAASHARAVWKLERGLFLPNEAWLQQVALHSVELIKLANRYYVDVHFPAVVLFVVWMYTRHRDAWPRIRAVLVGVTALALLVHLTYPLAPPRLTSGDGMVDTGALFGPSPYTDPEIDNIANQYAAMPSLHVGWALLEAYAVITLTRNRWRWLALIQPILTTLVVVVTANHYWLDGIIGAALLLAMIQLTSVIQRRMPDSQPFGLIAAFGAVVRRVRREKSPEDRCGSGRPCGGGPPAPQGLPSPRPSPR
jgi:hypothetical protein